MKKILSATLLVLLTATSVSAQWVLQSTNTIDNLVSIKFFNHSTGITIGYSRNITLRTSNGGSDWIQSQNPFINEYVNNLLMYDNLLGFACGENILYKTSDGGVNWISENYAAQNHSFYGLYFINPLTGWCCGDSNYYEYPAYRHKPVIKKTTDGGSSWGLQYTQNGNIQLNSVNFIDANTGWCIGGQPPIILKTTNSGTDWVSKPCPTVNQIQSVFFVNNLTGWICGYEGLLLKTVDGGESWFLQQTVGTNGMLLSVRFLNENTGWSVGTYGLILKTSNGGINWLQQSSPIGNAFSFLALDFIDVYTGWISGEYGKILKTTNGGVSYVNGNGEILPDKFLLFQNYPNPFNQTCLIKFIPSPAADVIQPVSLIVYDLKGNLIDVLFNGLPKNHEYKFVFPSKEKLRNSLPSGVYYLSLVSGNAKITKKMVMIK